VVGTGACVGANVGTGAGVVGTGACVGANVGTGAGVVGTGACVGANVGTGAGVVGSTLPFLDRCSRLPRRYHGAGTIVGVIEAGA
jgi:hypothetical protein